jgi:DNA-binding NtrC family response regulator
VALQEHLFIGNVRELINMIRQAVTLTNCMSLSVADFPGLSVASNNNLRIIKDKFYRFQATFEKFPSLDEVERLMVEEALHATEGSRVDAARMLGISRTTLLKKLNAEP